MSLVGPIPAVGWDLDSTVFNTQHRQYMVPLIREKKATWEEYSLMCDGDTVLPGRIEMMRVFHEAGITNIGVSGGNSSASEKRWEVIHKFDVPLDGLYLRPARDHCPNPELKVKGIRYYEGLGYKFRMFFEDWREAGVYIAEKTGIPVIILDPCYPATEPYFASGHEGV